MIDGRWIYGKLRACHSLKVSVRVYNDWIKTNSALVGFVCHVVGKDLKEEVLRKVRTYIEAHELPLIIEDVETHTTQFNLKIIKRKT